MLWDQNLAFLLLTLCDVPYTFAQNKTFETIDLNPFHRTARSFSFISTSLLPPTYPPSNLFPLLCIPGQCLARRTPGPIVLMHHGSHIRCTSGRRNFSLDSSSVQYFTVRRPTSRPSISGHILSTILPGVVIVRSLQCVVTFVRPTKEGIRWGARNLHHSRVVACDHFHHNDPPLPICFFR